MAELRDRTGIRALESGDLGEVVRIDGLHTGEEKLEYWQKIFDEYLGRQGSRTFGIGIDAADGLAAYLFGEVRAVEFGSEPCGWVFAAGVDKDRLRCHLGTNLLADARRRFNALGVQTVRTMVLRNNVSVLSFFRANGFVGGPYVQLEIHLPTDQGGA